jgi:hypothetical protein
LLYKYLKKLFSVLVGVLRIRPFPHLVMGTTKIVYKIIVEVGSISITICVKFGISVVKAFKKKLCLEYEKFSLSPIGLSFLEVNTNPISNLLLLD